MAGTWVVVCDAARARILVRAGSGPLELLRTLDHEESRRKGSEITSDRPGRVRQIGAGGAKAAMEPHTPPREVEANLFAHELARELERDADRFEVLIVVAPARFLGLLKRALSDRVYKTLRSTLSKDYTRLGDSEMIATLDRHI